MQIIDGRKIKKEILLGLKEEIKKLEFVPVFCDILVGNDPVSLQYVKLKKKTCEELGIKFHEAFFDEKITEEDLIKEIEKINNLENICGVIVQLPLPKHINTKNIISGISPELDVDCLRSNFENGPTAKACIYILDSLNLDLENKNIVVLGAGDLVGAPVAMNLKHRDLNFEVIRSGTINKEIIIKNADIIISGMGIPNYIKGDMVKKDVVIIDAGTSESNNSVVGDTDFDSIKDIVSFITPVPGGVGPVTVAMLMQNIFLVAKNKI